MKINYSLKAPEIFLESVICEKVQVFTFLLRPFKINYSLKASEIFLESVIFERV